MIELIIFLVLGMVFIPPVIMWETPWDFWKHIIEAI